jgi:transposase
MPFERVSARCWTAGTERRVLRVARPKYACGTCNKVMQAAAPKPLIALGPVVPALLAQVLISNTPLYRQSQEFC